MLLQLDEYGRVAELTAAPGDRVMMTGPAQTPIVPPMPADHRRSSHWPTFLHAFLKAHPLCLATGLPAETGHHVVPFHERPELELDPNNIVPVRVAPHFVIAHLGDWRKTNPRVREHLAAYRKWYDSIRS